MYCPVWVFSKQVKKFGLERYVKQIVSIWSGYPFPIPDLRTLVDNWHNSAFSQFARFVTVCNSRSIIAWFNLVLLEYCMMEYCGANPYTAGICHLLPCVVSDDKTLIVSWQHQKQTMELMTSQTATYVIIMVWNMVWCHKNVSMSNNLYIFVW